MTAIEIIKMLMKSTGMSLNSLSAYSDLGSRSNLWQMLNRDDLKVRTFMQMLETMGYELVVRESETGEEHVVDYDW